jgi:hypothetical protein
VTTDERGLEQRSPIHPGQPAGEADDLCRFVAGFGVSERRRVPFRDLDLPLVKR